MRIAIVVGVLLATAPAAPSQAETGSNTCVRSPALAPVPWDALRNPLVAYPDAAVKDMSVQWTGKQWVLAFSYITDRPFRFRLGVVRGATWDAWGAVEVYDQPETGGSASPDITGLADGSYLVTYNSHTRDTGSDRSKLWRRSSTDLARLGPAARLAPELFTGVDRVIDAAIAHTDAGLFLAYKSGDPVQIPTLARSPSGSIEGPWEVVGPIASIGLAENYQFLPIDGVWHLLVTSIDPTRPNGHRPVLYRMVGPPTVPASWLAWQRVRELGVPSEPWNTPEGEVANAAYLCDGRAVDGHWYLFYAGSTEVSAFQGRGHAKIGVARSRDLERWEVPSGRGASPPPISSTTPAAPQSAPPAAPRTLPATGGSPSSAPALAAAALGILLGGMVLRARRAR